MPSRRMFVLVAAISSIFLAVAGCTGGGGGGGKSAGPTSANTPADTLVIAEAATPTSLDSEFVGNQPQNLEAALNYDDALTALPTIKSPYVAGGTDVDTSKQPIPFVASSFTRSRDGMKYTFVLRHGVKSASGNELTSADALWSFDRSVALKGLCEFVMGISSVDLKNPVTVIDRYTFSINLTAPNVILPLALATIPICTIKDSTEVKKHATSSDPWAKSWLATHTAGFGAYQVASITAGEETDWVANPNYWQRMPAFKQIIVKAIPESSTREALLVRGDVDISVDLLPRERQQLEGKQGIVIEARPGTAGIILGMNNKMPPLDNQQVRQAVVYALPMDDIIKSVFPGSSVVHVAPGYEPSGYPGALPAWPYSYDLNKAKALLQQAGVTNPHLQLYYNTAESVEGQIATLIQSGLAEAGIDVTLNALSPAKYFEQYYSHKAQMVLVEDAPFAPDGPYVLGLYFDSNPTIGPANWVDFSNPTVDKLIGEGLASPDPAERAKLAEEANKLLVNEAPWGFELQVGNFLCRWADVTGYVWRTNNFLRFGDFSKA